MIVRPRHDRDLGICATGLAATHRIDGYPVRWPTDPEAWLRCDGRLGAWVGLVDGVVAGHVVLRCGSTVPGPGRRDPAGHDAWSATTGRDAGGHGIVSRLWVATWAQGRGLGRRLLATAASEADSRELRPVLDVMDRNIAAIKLYESLGWSRVGTRPFVFGDGMAMDLHLYVAPPPARAGSARTPPAGALPARAGSVP